LCLASVERDEQRVASGARHVPVELVAARGRVGVQKPRTNSPRAGRRVGR
jgi:hypothetical protein